MKTQRLIHGLFLALALAPCHLPAQRPNLAQNATATGLPGPLASDSGWGGGALPWDLVDGIRTYSTWARGLAFTGGAGNWAGQPAGLRQATIDFATSQVIDKVVLWHHGDNHVPAMTALSRIDWWDGSQWQDTGARRSMTRTPFGIWSMPDEYEFFPVSTTRIRWVFDNRQPNVLGQQNEHGWLYEFEVYSPQPSLAVNTAQSGFPNPAPSSPGWGGGAQPWDLVDGQRNYSNWARGLAFSGGAGGWNGQPAGIRQATIDLGVMRTFNRVTLWHHGFNHVPALGALSQIDVWNGAQWVTVNAARTFGRMAFGTQWSVSDEYDFAPVTASMVRWTMDNRQNNVLGQQNEHGWLYEFEVTTRSNQVTFGAGCAGSNGVPTLVPNSEGARVAEALGVDLVNLPPFAPAFGVLGLNDSTWSGNALPMSLAPFGMPGCSLFVSADATRPLPTGSSATVRWVEPLPFLPQLLGVDVFGQAFVLDPSANAIGMTMSNASRATIGWD